MKGLQMDTQERFSKTPYFWLFRERCQISYTQKKATKTKALATELNKKTQNRFTETQQQNFIFIQWANVNCYVYMYNQLIFIEMHSWRDRYLIYKEIPTTFELGI